MWQKLIGWCQGRHTAFAIYFTIAGTVLAVFHKLDVNFIMLIGAVQGLVLGHSIKEDVMDYMKAKQPSSEIAVIDNNAHNGADK